MPRLIEHKVHWRPALGTAVICKVTIPSAIVTGYLLGTLHKVTCKNCLKQMKTNPNISKAMWEVINHAHTD